MLLVALQAELDICSWVNVILQRNSRCISADFALACSKHYIRVAGLIMIVIMDVISLNDALELLCFVHPMSQNVLSINVWLFS